MADDENEYFMDAEEFNFNPKMYINFIYDCILVALLTLRVLFENVYKFVCPPPPKSLRGEIILVTGGANGIGREICLQLAKTEKRLTIISWDIDEKNNKLLVKALQALGVMRAYGFKVDVRDREEVRLEAIRIRQEIGEVTMLFNNAGIAGELKEGWRMSAKSILAVFHVNLISHCWMLQEFLPKMIERKKGHVVESCSILSFAWGKYGSPYISSKHGLKAYVECIKEDLRSLPENPNVVFTMVYPHNTLTKLTARANLIAKKYPFLLPQLKPKYVAEKIVQGMLRNDEHVFIPFYYRIIVMILAFLPPQVIQRITDLPEIESGWSTDEGFNNLPPSGSESSSEGSQESFLSLD